MTNYIGEGRRVVDLIADTGTFIENRVGAAELSAELAPGAMVGTAKIDDETVTVIANDAKQANPRFPVVHSGLIGLEEAYKMAEAVYRTIDADAGVEPSGKRPIVLIVDTPGNAPGKLEEIVGMNKATVSYQLAMAEARKAGHPSVALVVGRAISGGFLCHGLHADRVISLSDDFNTMVHVMPVTSIARIIKVPLDILRERVKTNPVFASGATFARQIGAVDEILDDDADLKKDVARVIAEIRAVKKSGDWERLGPPGRLRLGIERGGRPAADKVMDLMRREAEEALGEFA